MKKNRLQQQAEELIESLDFSISDIKPSEFAEVHRTMTSDVSAIKGKFDYRNSPYSREIVDCLHPDHPARRIAVMKSPQTGISAGVIENGVVWIISENPGNVMMISGDLQLSKQMVDKRLDQAIDSCGLRHLIRPNAMRKRNQRTGDTSESKEFAGGSLVAGGPNNPNMFRQHSIMYGFFDDFDAAKMTDKKEGNIMELYEGRFTTFATKMKAFYISTPTIKGGSNIEMAYQRSDMRKFYMPCPICGEMIDYQFRIEVNGEKYGILFDLTREGKLDKESVRYRCQKCGKEFEEKEKYKMLNNGIWVPTNEPEDDTFYGYHINGLMLPPGSTTWVDQTQKFINCYPNGFNHPANTQKLKVFINQVLGETYAEKGKAPKGIALSQNVRNYKVGVIPESKSQKDGNGDIIMITCACDLNGKDDDVRLDYEVVAWSENLSSYSIDQGSIGTFYRGKSDEGREKWTHRVGQPRNVWDEFKEKVVTKYYDSDIDGRQFGIHILGVDVGFQSIDAHRFVDAMQYERNPIMTIGVKGQAEKKITKYANTEKSYKKSTARNSFYIIESNYYKTILSEFMDLKVSDETNQPGGFMNFPQPENGKYNSKSFFIQFESEERKEELNADGTAIGYFWDKKHSTVNNHFWDCRYYNIAVKDIFSRTYLEIHKVKDGSWEDYCLMVKG